MAEQDVIAAYLAEVRQLLKVGEVERAVLHEVEDHLRELVDDEAITSTDQAAHRAIARFGSARDFVAGVLAERASGALSAMRWCLSASILGVIGLFSLESMVLAQPYSVHGREGLYGLLSLGLLAIVLLRRNQAIVAVVAAPLAACMIFAVVVGHVAALPTGSAMSLALHVAECALGLVGIAGDVWAVSWVFHARRVRASTTA